MRWSHQVPTISSLTAATRHRVLGNSSIARCETVRQPPRPADMATQAEVASRAMNLLRTDDRRQTVERSRSGAAGGCT
ncbi:MAG: hypothetical protein ACYC4U_25125 [Pirellulaceae bacterium]